MGLSPNGKYKQGSGKIPTSKTLRPCEINSNCLDLIFKCLKTRDDRNSFGLTCHQWLHIQNNNQESLGCRYNHEPDKYPKSSPELFFDLYSDMQLSLLFSWFPRLTRIDLYSPNIADSGLVALAECCPSLKTVDLWKCCSITDSGLSCLLQKCRELHSLNISSGSSITGIGFLGCAQTLTHLAAGECNLTPEGINAIVSSGDGGLEYLYSPDIT
ncbi:hypothetical protein MKX01_014426 [Papaver californicum]|nr:hypothetical protein MKX01_014426 [Papaver californicum]